MASSPPPAKKTSGWGSFLSQAVAGVESRLDTILAEDDDRTTKTSGKAVEQPAQPRLSASPQHVGKGRTGSLSRSPSSAKTNDRLQERLARAMAQKNSSKRTESPASSAGPPSRTSTPALGTDTQRSSFEGTQDQPAQIAEEDAPKEELKNTTPELEARSGPEEDVGLEKQELEPPVSFAPTTPETPGVSLVSSPVRGSLDSSQGDTSFTDKQQTPDITLNGSTFLDSAGNAKYEAAMAQLKAEHEASELRWQEELHGYVEKLDSLQSKLQYLTREAMESAKQTASAAASGSLEKKLAEKEVQVAQLMDEGQKLSKTELKHMNTIKKLRTQTAATEKSKTELKARAEKAERDLSNADDKLKRAEVAEKRLQDKSNQLAKTERELSAACTERDSLNATISEFKAQLTRATARADAAEAKAQNEPSELEKRQIAELKDDLTSAKIERELSEEKLRREIRDLQQSVEREKEKARIQEIELRGEQSVLESKLETMRARAEEVSTGATSDAQAKLLRQIETLQTQYSIASENWQGIEGSLLSRLANMEKERDDIARREAELRKKSREGNTKVKKAEADLEFSNSRIEELERSLAVQQEDLKKLRAQLQQTQQESRNLKQDIAQRQETWESTLASRIEEEKSKWNQQDLMSLSRPKSRNDSPGASVRKPSDFNLLALRDPVGSLADRPPSRRSSFQPPQHVSSERGTPTRQGSTPSLGHFPFNGTNHHMLPPETPSIIDPADEFFAETPASSGTHRGSTTGINDLLSHTTIPAGPSVQLVERLSQTVRRLESERSTSKDELSRLTAQRDEARQEVVELMKEIETKREGDEKIAKLDKEVAELNSRYQASLEMLGEKSERVEELQADVSDLKRILRETVESMTK